MGDDIEVTALTTASMDVLLPKPVGSAMANIVSFGCSWSRHMPLMDS